MTYKLTANLITAGSICFGFLAIIAAFDIRFIQASWFILVCVVLDIIDGKIARLSKIINPFGKEFDSLADLISFVIAPAVLIYCIISQQFFLPFLKILPLTFSIIYIIAGSARLAKFNVDASRQRLDYFKGLPTTASGAFLAATTLVIIRFNLFTGNWQFPVLLLIQCVLSILMVIPFIIYPNTIKFKSIKKIAILLSITFIIFLFLKIELTLWIVLFGYIIAGPYWYKNLV